MLDFEGLTKPLLALENTEVGRCGYVLSKGFWILLLQYIEALSDREFEGYLQENLAAKLFCDFSLESPTPNFSYFSKLRTKIGTKRLADLFNEVRESLKKQL